VGLELAAWWLVQALKPADRGGRIEVKGLSKREITDVQSGRPYIIYAQMGLR
jgi:hypothetical protein